MIFRRILLVKLSFLMLILAACASGRVTQAVPGAEVKNAVEPKSIVAEKQNNQ